MEQKWIDLYPEYFGPKAVDPDLGKGDEELTDLLAQIATKATGYGGTFSTWGERHAFIVGYEIGFALDKIEAVPTPEFWKSEAHYFKAGIACGYSAKELLKAAPSWRGYIAAYAAGGASGIALKFLGVS